MCEPGPPRAATSDLSYEAVRDVIGQLSQTEQLVLRIAHDNNVDLGLLLSLKLGYRVTAFDRAATGFTWAIEVDDRIITLPWSAVCAFESDLCDRRMGVLFHGQTPPSRGPFFYDEDCVPISTSSIRERVESMRRTGQPLRVE